MGELKPHMSPDEVLDKFKVGNRRFLEGKLQFRDQLVDVKRTALGQTPRAIVLGCIDSRKPAEIIFDKGLGDMFNARVAAVVLHFEADACGGEAEDDGEGQGLPPCLGEEDEEDVEAEEAGEEDGGF